MKKKKPTILLIATIITGILLSSCQPAKPAALSEDQVVQVTDHILKAISSNDYQGFRQDFSEQMNVRKRFSVAFDSFASWSEFQSDHAEILDWFSLRLCGSAALR